MPDSTGQANFSASGDCLTMTGRDAWFGAGGDDGRVYHSVDRGETWTVEDAEVPSGEAAWVFALDFTNPRQGLAVGGDFEDPTVGTSSRSGDGQRWATSGGLTHLGEEVAWLKQRRATALWRSVKVGESVVRASRVRWPDVAADQRGALPHARVPALG